MINAFAMSFSVPNLFFFEETVFFSPACFLLFSLSVGKQNARATLQVILPKFCKRCKKFSAILPNFAPCQRCKQLFLQARANLATLHEIATKVARTCNQICLPRILVANTQCINLFVIALSLMFHFNHTQVTQRAACFSNHSCLAVLIVGLLRGIPLMRLRMF